MLKIHHSYHLPQFSSAHQRPAFSRVSSTDNDELIQSIEAEKNDDQWVLDDGPDGVRLSEFWEGVEQDISKDPEWFTFTND